MREYVDKIKKIFASQNFIRYREANDSLIIDSFYTDPVANDHTIGVMIYKTEDGKLRIDDMKMIDEILDVNKHMKDVIDANEKILTSIMSLSSISEETLAVSEESTSISSESLIKVQILESISDNIYLSMRELEKYFEK